MNTYGIMFGNEEREIQATSLYAAAQQAEIIFKVPKSKRGLLVVMLLRKAGESADVVHDGAELPGA